MSRLLRKVAFSVSRSGKIDRRGTVIDGESQPEVDRAHRSSKGPPTRARFPTGFPPLRRPSGRRFGDARAASRAVLEQIERGEDLPVDVSDLVRRAQDGDELAFAELYATFFDRVYRYLLIALKNPDDAQEVSQDAFVRALTMLDRYEVKRGDFRDWLFRMVRNLAIDHLRKGSRSTSVDPEAMPSSAVPVAERAVSLLEHLDPHSAVRTLVSDLPDAQRRVVTLRFVFGLRPDQVADVLGSTNAAVRCIQHRALKALAGGLVRPQHRAVRDG